jgi:precorrin-6A/cobalt-precorrin-6A reductase
MGDPILRHDPRRGGGRIWLIAGTGEGPRLAGRLLARGWRLRVSVVSRTAALAYPRDPALELRQGAIGGGAPPPAAQRELERQLEAARRDGDAFGWVIDASHPFAARISAALAAACRRQSAPLLRLTRPQAPLDGAELLGDLDALEGRLDADEPLLLAIGARQLARAVARCPTARHHARVLPRPGALRLAIAAGLPAERIACLHPAADPRQEAALCRHWGIASVLCRRSGPPTETRWRAISRELGLRLLLLDRPPDPAGVLGLEAEDLLARVGLPTAAAAAAESAPVRPPVPNTP